MMFNWETIGSGDLLMLALPHHMDTMETNGKTILEVDVLKGNVGLKDTKYLSYKITFVKICNSIRTFYF